MPRSPVPEGVPLAPPVDLGQADRDLDLHGVVVEADGAPVAGAIVEVVTYPWRRGAVLAHARHDTELVGPTSTSASDGTFALRLRRGTSVTLRIRAEGFPVVEASDRQPGERVRIVLRPGVSLVLRAVDGAGTPVVGVAFKLRIRHQGGNGGLDREGTTNEEGRIRIDDLPAGGNVVLTSVPSRTAGWTWKELRLPDEGEAEQEIVVPRGRVVRGRVTDEAAGRPVAGARVGMGWSFVQTTRTDPDGRYELGGWTGNGYFEVHVLANGFARAQRAVRQATDVDFALRRGFAAEGRAVDVSGTPLTRARVAVIGELHQGDIQRISTASGPTDDAGRFRFEDLTRGLPHLLVVMAEGHGRYVLEFEAPSPPLTTLDLGDVTVPEARLLAGRVLGADGQPMARVLVDLSGSNTDWDRLRPGADQHVSMHYGRSEELRTDDLGRFSFADLAPGHYMLSASRPDAGQTTAEVDIRPGADREDVELRFGAARTFRVVVRDARGKPISDVVAYVRPRGSAELIRMTDREGVAAFALPVGTRQAEVLLHTETHLAPDTQIVDLPKSEYVVTLEDAAVVRGRLVDEGGDAVRRGQVRALRGDETVAWTMADESGRFTLAFAPGAPVDLEFLGETWLQDDEGYAEIRRRPLEARRRGVVPGPEEVLLRAVRIPADRTLRVVVETAAGVAIEGAPVRVEPPPADGPASSTATDGEGSSTFEGLTAHPITVVVQAPKDREADFAVGRKADVVAAGQTVVLVLPVPLRLEGVCVDGDGKRVAGATVRASGFPGMANALSDEDGRFVLALPPDIDVRVDVAAFCETAERVFLVAEVSGADPRAGPLRLVLKPNRGWR